MSPSSTASNEPPRQLRRQFWLLVGLLNVAMLALALGGYVLAFWSRPAVGVGFLAVGVAAAVFAWQRYRRVSDEFLDAE